MVDFFVYLTPVMDKKRLVFLSTTVMFLHGSQMLLIHEATIGIT